MKKERRKEKGKIYEKMKKWIGRKTYIISFKSNKGVNIK
jgi:hypothetical protein